MVRLDHAGLGGRVAGLCTLPTPSKKVSKVGEVEVRGLPEGAVFSPDGRWLYVGKFVDSDVSVLRVDDDTVTNTGTLVKLPGRPASMRGARSSHSGHCSVR